MGLPVVTVASGGLPVVESLIGLPVTEAASGRGLAVTKVLGGKPGLPVVFVAGGSSFATLDQATAVATTLSGGNLTATHADTTVNSGVRSSSYKSSGKYYFEIMMNVSAAADMIGIIAQSGTYQQALVSLLNATAVARNTGNIITNDGSAGKNIGGFAAGNVMGAAVNLDIRKSWLRRGAAGNWNGLAIGSEDPAIGLGGVIIEAALAFSPFVAFGPTSVAGDSYTVNCGATAFAGIVPAGFFAGWPA